MTSSAKIWFNSRYEFFMLNQWNKAIANLEARLPSHTFNTWIRPMCFKNHVQGQYQIEVPNSFYRDRIQSTYASLICKELREVSQDVNATLDLILPQTQRGEATLDQDHLRQISLRQAAQNVQKQKLEKRDKNLSNLNQKYVFDNFVVGNNNQFAHAAAQAVSEKPGQQYNPLFIYGGVGLGKTHLLCSIGNLFQNHFPGKNVVYCSSEEFTNQLIQAIRHQKTTEFRKMFREQCQLLLIDDIQFLSGKERTQEEFFHTFNVLHQQNVQIVVSSDRLPREIQDIDDRLRSRFEMGLLCDIQPADFETRIAILRKKSQESGLDLSDQVCNNLAERFPDNIRTLEGALLRLCAHASLGKQDITPDFIDRVFGPAQSTKQITVLDIQKKVADFYHIQVSDLKSSSRKKLVALPRQIAMYLSRKKTSLSFPELGQKFGGKDHTTILHAVKKIESLIETDSTLKHSVQAIDHEL